jgi:hypothetical protein
MSQIPAFAFMIPLIVPIALCIVEAARLYRERDQ